jgi:hypothetical protein
MSLRFRPLLRGICTVLGVLQIVAVLCAFEKPALAYVDPGSGYVLLQVIGSMCAGSIFYLRHRLRRMLGLVSDGTSEPGSSSSSSPQE